MAAGWSSFICSPDSSARRYKKRWCIMDLRAMAMSSAVCDFSQFLSPCANPPRPYNSASRFSINNGNKSYRSVYVFFALFVPLSLSAISSPMTVTNVASLIIVPLVVHLVGFLERHLHYVAHRPGGPRIGRVYPYGRPVPLRHRGDVIGHPFEGL